jgi:hypothetical protein
VRVHDLKNTFGRRLRTAGVQLETRKVLLGHKTGDITSHYSAPELAELIRAANAVLKTQESTLLRVVTRQVQVINGDSHAKVAQSYKRARSLLTPLMANHIRRLSKPLSRAASLPGTWKPGQQSVRCSDPRRRNACCP